METAEQKKKTHNSVMSSNVNHYRASSEQDPEFIDIQHCLQTNQSDPRKMADVL